MPIYTPLNSTNTVNELIDRVNNIANDVNSVPAGAVSGPGSATVNRLAIFADTLGYTIKDDTAVVSTFAYTLLDDTSANAMRTTLAAQASSASLTALAAPTYAANTIPYFDTASSVLTTPLTAFGRSLIDDADASAARTTLELGSSATIAATNLNTASTIVQRDVSGNFSAGTITAALNGNASSATTAAACSGNAASATTSAACSGNAVTATTATTANALNAENYYTVAGLTIGTGAASSITMQDSDQGARMILCNGNRVGFLTQAGGWGSWCEDSGDWASVGNVIAYSDIRLKTNIEIISNALDKVCTLQGVTFDRIDSGTRQTGVIAQEVQAVLPEAVVEGTDENKTLSVAYGNLAGLLIEAIKELKAEIDELKKGR